MDFPLLILSFGCAIYIGPVCDDYVRVGIRVRMCRWASKAALIPKLWSCQVSTNKGGRKKKQVKISDRLEYVGDILRVWGKYNHAIHQPNRYLVCKLSDITAHGRLCGGWLL